MTDDEAGTGPAWLTAQQVADRFGVTVRAVNRWARQGRLTPVAVTLGGHYRFDPAEVEAAAAQSLATKASRGKGWAPVVDWRDHRPVVAMARGSHRNAVLISCTCGQVLGRARTTDGLPPVLLMIHRHRATLA
jgi:excisionase family DNA binding protein